MRLERRGGAARDVGGRFAGLRGARVRARHGGAGTHQRRVGVAKERDVGDGERADRLAVVAAGEIHEAVLAGAARVAPVVRGHLQRDLGRRGAVGGVERVSEMRAGQRGEPLGQLDDRLVREAGQHRMLERVELRAQRGVDVRVAVAEEIHPPRADAVEQAPPVRVDQPRPFAAHDRHERQRLVLFHLRAGVPDGGERTGEEGLRMHGGRRKRNRSMVRNRPGPVKPRAAWPPAASLAVSAAAGRAPGGGRLCASHLRLPRFHVSDSEDCQSKNWC